MHINGEASKTVTSTCGSIWASTCPPGEAHSRVSPVSVGSNLRLHFGSMTHYFARFCAIWKIFLNIYPSGRKGVGLSKWKAWHISRTRGYVQENKRSHWSSGKICKAGHIGCPVAKGCPHSQTREAGPHPLEDCGYFPESFGRLHWKVIHPCWAESDSILKRPFRV